MAHCSGVWQLHFMSHVEKQRKSLHELHLLSLGVNAGPSPIKLARERKSEATQYRGLTARMNYLGQDRSDIQFATKELCRKMSNANRGDWKKLKRLARYLIAAPRLVAKISISRYKQQS